MLVELFVNNITTDLSYNLNKYTQYKLVLKLFEVACSHQCCAIRDWNKLQNKRNSESALLHLSGHKFLKATKKIIADRVDL